MYPFINPAQVFAGIYPVDSSDFEKLSDAMDKLTLHDSSVTVTRESSNALGLGFRCGFLGMLHLDVFQQRLQQVGGRVLFPFLVSVLLYGPQCKRQRLSGVIWQEFEASVIVTPPTVPYKGKRYWLRITCACACLRVWSFRTCVWIACFLLPCAAILKRTGEELLVDNPVHFPELHTVSEFLEPMVNATLVTPESYLGSILEFCQVCFVEFSPLCVADWLCDPTRQAFLSLKLFFPLVWSRRNEVCRPSSQ